MTCPRCGRALVEGHVCEEILAATMPMPRAAARVASPEMTTEPVSQVPIPDATTRIVVDPTLPEVVEGYRLRYVVGSGGMASVYLADRGAERVAIKVTRRTKWDENTVKRALREAKASARAHHANVAEVRSTGLLPDGRPYLITELLEGDSLDALLRSLGRLPWSAVVAVLDDVAAGLEAAHAQFIVHRDLKPGNVFIARGPDSVRAKILDFGIALLGEPGQLVPQTNTGFVPGTVEYISPEQSRGDALDSASDLYSLGVMAFELLSGSTPFTAPTASAVLRLHNVREAPRLKTLVDVPAGLDRLVDGLLAKDPADRPQSATEVREALALLKVPRAGVDSILGELVDSWLRRTSRPGWSRALRRVLSIFR